MRPSDPLFATLTINFAAYLIAADKLRFCGTRFAEKENLVELLFDDPENSGAELLRQYNDEKTELNVRVLFETRRFLASEVARTRRMGGLH